jgi:transcriptional regulator with XRE-family HTH domain
LATETRSRPRPRTRHVSTYIDFWLGQQLRGLRKERGLSLQALATDCGISVGTLSQVERGITSASVKTLSRLAQQLDVSVNRLLRNVEKQDGELGGRVARAKDHRAIVMKDRKILKEIITPRQCTSLDLYRVRIKPGGSTGDDLFITDGGEIAGTVIHGSMELWIENRLVLLQEGDSFCYLSTAPRRWSNPGDVDTCVIWAIPKVSRQLEVSKPRSRT